MTYALGRLQSTDERDKQFKMASLLQTVDISTLPKYKTWVPGVVLDQGNKPYCVGYSWKQFLQTSPIRTKTGPSADDIYHSAQQLDEWPGENYDGTSVRGGAKALQSMNKLVSYHWATNIVDIKNFILSTGTVVVGTLWYSDMFTPNSKGFVNLTGTVVGGHAWLILGYSDSKKSFRAINSWGRGWGQNGRFWIKEMDLQRLLDEDGEACTAVEK